MIRFLKRHHWMGLAFLLVYAWFVFINNRWDWDYFYSGFLVDRNAWLTEFKPPIWSYPMCGGISRIADPQAFGLSPAFLLILIFGAVLGTKVYLLILFAIAYFYLVKIAKLVARWDTESPSEVSQFVSVSFALQLLTSSYFLWQIIAGHLTQMMMAWLIALLYYHLLAFTRKLTRREWGTVFLIGWIYFSGGIYHSFIFFAVPFAIGLYLMLVSDLLIRPKNWRAALRNFRTHLTMDSLAILPGLYKLIPVYLYQQQFPRGGGGEWDTQDKLLNFFLFQFIPTRGPKLEWLHELASVHYTIWELGSFSPLGWLLIITLLLVLGFLIFARNQLTRPTKQDWRILIFLGLSFIVSFLFVLGNFSPRAPYTLFNHHILHDSAHITERFHICTTLLFGLFCLWFLGRLKSLSGPVFYTLFTLGSGVSMINLYWAIQDYPSEVAYSDIIAPSSSSVAKQMNTLVVHKDIAWPPMFPHLNQGHGFINCYNPLIRDQMLLKVTRQIMQNLEFTPSPYSTHTLPLIDPALGNPSEQCIKESYFTSSTLSISPLCTPGVCLNLVWVPKSDPWFDRLVQLNDHLCLK